MLILTHALFQTFRYGIAVLKALCIHMSSGAPSGLRKNFCHSPCFLFLNVPAQAPLWSSQGAWDDPSCKLCFLLGRPVTVGVPTASPCNVPEKGTTYYFDTYILAYSCRKGLKDPSPYWSWMDELKQQTEPRGRKERTDMNINTYKIYTMWCISLLTHPMIIYPLSLPSPPLCLSLSME